MATLIVSLWQTLTWAVNLNLKLRRTVSQVYPLVMRENLIKPSDRSRIAHKRENHRRIGFSSDGNEPV